MVFYDFKRVPIGNPVAALGGSGRRELAAWVAPVGRRYGRQPWVIEGVLPTAADRLQSEAVKLRAEGRAAEALAKVEEALANDPRHAAAQIERLELLVEAGRTTDARAALAAITRYVNDNPEVQTNGRLTAKAAAAMNAYVTAQVSAALTRPNGVPMALNVRALVNTTDNLVNTRQLRFTITGTPYGYASTVTATVGFRLNTGS